MPIRPENRKRYAKNWKEISAWVRFKRARGVCECDGRCGHDHIGRRCGEVHGSRHSVTGSVVVLTTAHLDHQPENNEEDNLMAMCQRCHLAYDAEHHRQTAYATKMARAQTVEMEF